MRILAVLLLSIMTLAFVAPSFAAGEKGRDYRRFLDEISEVNRLQVLQRPEYEKAKDILLRTIEDEQNRVVGDVMDIVLSGNGSITSISAEFDRLHLRTPVFLNYRELRVQPVSTGYRMPMTESEIEDLYPELLASIETASGPGSDEFSIRSLIGSTVESTDGRRLGEVEDVLFRSLGSRADLLYISMTYGTLRGREIAIPFEMVTYRPNGNGKIIQPIVSEDQADAMIDYAKKN